MTIEKVSPYLYHSASEQYVDNIKFLVDELTKEESDLKENHIPYSRLCQFFYNVRALTKEVERGGHMPVKRM